MVRVCFKLGILFNTRLSMVDGKKALPYKHVIVAYGTAIVGLPSQIAYGRGVEKCHVIVFWQLAVL